MNPDRPTRPRSQPPGEPAPRPWYREPWPWVLIAIPAVAVIASLATLYLALANPDYVVLDVDRYQEIRAGLRAQAGSGDEVGEDAGDDEAAGGETPDDPAAADSHGDR